MDSSVLIISLLSVLLAASLTGVGFMIANRPNWRKWFTGEVKLELKLNEALTDDNGEFRYATLRYDITCSRSESFLIKHFYIVLPKDTFGNPGIAATTFELIQGAKGKDFLQMLEVEVDKYKGYEFHIGNTTPTKKVLQCINSGKLKSIVLVIETNKYGTIKSNAVRLKK